MIAADDCQIGASDSVIVFRQGSKKIASKMIAGKYPDMIAGTGYNSQEFGRELIADRDSLLSAAKACVSMDLSSNYGTSVHVFADDGEAVLFASKGDGNTIEIPFEAHGDSVADFVLGARYLVDALSVIPAETVKIRSGEPSYVAITWSGDGHIVTYRQRPKPWHMRSRGKFGEAA
jgi:DNA polymerase III sliding clamp (beta) subunit (PCNA family)